MTLSKETACEILGLPNHFTTDEAVIRYKHLALKWFPDLHENSEAAVEEFSNINEAVVALVYGERPLGRLMTLTEMFSLFQSIFFGDSNSFDNDDDDDYDDIETNDSYGDDDLYDSDYDDVAFGGSTLATAERKIQANQKAEELIEEEEREKKKAERRRAKKKRRKERKRQEKATENAQPKLHLTSTSSTCETNISKESNTSDSEESIDTSSAFVAVIAKKKKHIPICEPKQKQEIKPPPKKLEPEKVTDDATLKVLRSRQLAIRGNEMANLGHFNQATDLFSESIKLDPSDHRFYGNRSYCFDRLGQFERALKDAEKSITLCPNWPKGYYRKGRACLGLGNYARAEDCFVQVLKLDNDCEDAIKELQSVKILQLTEMGYSHDQAEDAIAKFGSVQHALNSLLGFQADAAEQLTRQLDLFISDDESENLFAKPLSKPIATTSNAAPPRFHMPQPYDIKMDPTNPEQHNSIWIGNVQPGVTEKKLTTMFGKYGELLSVKVLPEKFCAFVNFKNRSSPGKAMQAYQGFELCGANLVIRFPNLPGQSTAPTGNKAKVKTVVSIPEPSNSKAAGPVNDDECYFWRTTGCIYGDACRFRHIKESKGMDKKGWHVI